MAEGPRWTQFRRLLLGTFVELVQEAGVRASLSEVAIEFHEGSAFEVPRFDNYMRFVGRVQVGLLEDPSAQALEALEHTLRTVWPELLQVVDLPIGDRLTESRNHTSAEVMGSVLHVSFDLVAD